MGRPRSAYQCLFAGPGFVGDAEAELEPWTSPFSASTLTLVVHSQVQPSPQGQCGGLSSCPVRFWPFRGEAGKSCVPCFGL